MKKLFLIFCLSPFLAFAQKNENNAPMQQRVQLNNFIDSFSYAIGLNVSNSLMQQGVMTLNIGAMSQAFIDMMTNKDKQFSGEMANAIIQAQFQQIAQSKAAVVEEIILWVKPFQILSRQMLMEKWLTLNHLGVNMF